MFAGIAMPAVKIWIAGYDHPRLNAVLVILIRLNDLSRKLMARNSRVIKIREGSAVRAQITSADSAVKDL